MATLTLGDALWTRVCTAMANTYGLQVVTPAVRDKDNSVVTPEVLETRDQLARRKIAEYLKQTVGSDEARVAMKVVQDTQVAAQKIATDKVQVEFPAVV